VDPRRPRGDQLPPAGRASGGGALTDPTGVLVGLDVGTSSLKAVAIADDGEPVAAAEIPYEVDVPRQGWSEQDPERWTDAAERALDSLGVRPAAVGLSGQMHGLVTLDDRDRVVRPAILWNDQRTAKECRDIEQRIGLDRLISVTGNRALTGFTAPKILWLRDHEPDAVGRIRSVMLPKDFVRLRLTGERATDVADASGTLLLDVGGRRWSETLVEELGIDPAWLPDVVESPTPTGKTVDGAIVAAGAGDQAAGALGVGVIEPASASIVIGTSGVVFAPLSSYAPDPLARVHTFCHAAPSTWHTMGVMLSAGASLRWLRDVVAPGESFTALVERASAWPPGADGLTFLPYLTGERTPHDDPYARGAFVGLTIRHDVGALVRAVLEGVAFGLRQGWDLMRAAGSSPTDVRASGGGSRSDLWLRIVASALGVPVRRTRVDAGAALGAALLGGVAAGRFSSVAEAASMFTARDIVDPEPSWIAAYEAAFERFRALYPVLNERPGSVGVRT
jgi:xylulokinase